MRSLRTAIALAVAPMLLIAAPAVGGSADKSAKESLCRRSEFRVVIDVGHTAESPGATSARGVPEYEFNLSAALWIERALAGAGFTQAERLITNGPAKPSLHERVAYANSLPADLFLSIHHDSVPEKFLQDWEHDGHRLHFSDRFEGHSIFVSKANSRYAASLKFGQLLGRQLKARGLQYTPHYTRADMGRRRRQLVDADAGVYRYDRLIVLRTTRMPAVLLEVASIINRDQELEASDPERLTRVAAAVTSAVEKFCAARAERTAERGKPSRVLRASQPTAERSPLVPSP